MPYLRRQFSLAKLMLAILFVAAAVAIGRPWLPWYQDPNVLPWRAYSPELVKRLRQQRRPLLIFFQADWDLTAHSLRANVVNTREVRSAAEERGYVPVLVDCTKQFPGWPIPAEWTEIKSLGLKGRHPITIVVPSGGNPSVVLSGDFTKEELVAAIQDQRSD